MERKKLRIYIAAAYGVTFLMGLLMWYGTGRHFDLSAFPNAQMFYPAAGVMLGILCTQKEDVLVPKVFYCFFVCVTGIMAAVAVLSIVNPYAMIFYMGIPVPLWTLMQQLFIIGASIAGWIILLATKKEKRRAYGLCWNKGASSWFCIVLFVAVYSFRTVITALWSGQMLSLIHI